jgi:hypothetical protein
MWLAQVETEPEKKNELREFVKKTYNNFYEKLGCLDIK